MLSLLLCCLSHAACLQCGRWILAQGSCCRALLTPGRSPVMKVLVLCTIAYEGECQQECLPEIWYQLSLQGENHSGFTIDLMYAGRSSQLHTESQAPCTQTVCSGSALVLMDGGRQTQSLPMLTVTWDVVYMVQCVCYIQLPTSVLFPAPKSHTDAKQLSVTFCLFYPFSEVKCIMCYSLFCLGVGKVSYL